MAYQVEPIKSVGIGHFQFRIYKDSRAVATYWYNVRDNQHGFLIENKAGETWSLTNAKKILDGGGQVPLKLTEYALAFLGQKLQSAK